MLKKFFPYIPLIFILLFSFQSCSEEDPGDNASRLRLKLTDASALVIREFYVEIKEISVFLEDTTGNDGEWIPLQFKGKTYDILKLSNGKTEQMVDQYVPAGKELRRIRLLFGTNNRFITNTDSTHPLLIPSELEEGAVIDAVAMELRANTISSMIIDLNAAVSIKESNGNYFLHPVARAFPEIYGGILQGYVAPPAANPFIAIIQDEDTLFSHPETENPGDNKAMFRFIGLREGEWEVHVLADPGTNYNDTVLISTVEAGKTTTLTPNPIRLKESP